MNPVLDQLLVAAAIGSAIGFFLVRAYRSRKKRGGCSSQCGCSLSSKGKR